MTTYNKRTVIPGEYNYRIPGNINNYQVTVKYNESLDPNLLYVSFPSGICTPLHAIPKNAIFEDLAE